MGTGETSGTHGTTWGRGATRRGALRGAIAAGAVGLPGALAMQRAGMEVLTNDVIALFANEPFAKGVAPMPKGRAG
ncbi:MAG TPA: hypothetical protein VH257_19495, partial [Chloroflexota bacterium]|nr:hypothetical protein [Chloroflexota bacterium]